MSDTRSTGSDGSAPPDPPGRVEALWVKRARGGPMDPADAVTLHEGRGIEGNADQGGWRQVTVIEAEVFEALADRLGPDVSPAMRRANVLVRGIRLEECRGRILHLGKCRIEMRGETRPCHQMDEQLRGLREALDPGWGGGAFGRVLDGGEIAVGDPARWGDSGAAGS